MTMSVKPVPDGFHSVTPYLVCNGAAKEIDFMKKSFGAVELGRHDASEGKVMHALLRVGNSMVMLGDAKTPAEAMPCMLCLYVEDTDDYYRRAMAAGATSVRAPQNMFYGDRTAGVMSPAGNQWWFLTHIEDVSPEEMEKRMRAQGA
jgi:uncharacterized glyoxalase superfamily protein PhnB